MIWGHLFICLFIIYLFDFILWKRRVLAYLEIHAVHCAESDIWSCVCFCFQISTLWTLQILHKEEKDVREKWALQCSYMIFSPSSPGQVRGSCGELLCTEGSNMHTGKSEVRIHSKCAALLGMLGHHHGFTDFADLTDLCWKQDECVDCVQDADLLLRPKTVAGQEKAHPNKSHTSSFCMAPGQGQGQGRRCSCFSTLNL